RIGSVLIVVVVGAVSVVDVSSLGAVSVLEVSMLGVMVVVGEVRIGAVWILVSTGLRVGATIVPSRIPGSRSVGRATSPFWPSRGCWSTTPGTGVGRPKRTGGATMICGARLPGRAMKAVWSRFTSSVVPALFSML